MSPAAATVAVFALSIAAYNCWSGIVPVLAVRSAMKELERDHRRMLIASEDLGDPRRDLKVGLLLLPFYEKYSWRFLGGFLGLLLVVPILGVIASIWIPRLKLVATGSMWIALVGAVLYAAAAALEVGLRPRAAFVGNNNYAPHSSSLQDKIYAGSTALPPWIATALISVVVTLEPLSSSPYILDGVLVAATAFGGGFSWWINHPRYKMLRDDAIRTEFEERKRLLLQRRPYKAKRTQLSRRWRTRRVQS